MKQPKQGTWPTSPPVYAFRNLTLWPADILLGMAFWPDLERVSISTFWFSRRRYIQDRNPRILSPLAISKASKCPVQQESIVIFMRSEKQEYFLSSQYQ
jgi:hypothetical protein